MPFRFSRTDTLIGLVLLAAAMLAYAPAIQNGFVNLDDGLYVTENVETQAGLSWSGVSWAFTTGHASNWHPLTWLSHMLDCQLWGLEPRGHHATSIALHALNGLLLFLFLLRATGARWPSAFTAALFLLHPLHVESVAWVAERKDVLSTLFWFLALLAYLQYVKKPSIWRYGLVALWFALGLMSKPMLVTLPCTLLLLDYWPFGRLREAKGARAWLRGAGKLILEKAPLFLLSAGASWITLSMQQQGGALRTLDAAPMDLRIANALVSCWAYIGKTLLPRPLSAYYPFPESMPPIIYIVLSAAGLVLVSALVIGLWRRAPWAAVGWFWFLGTLAPVIGIVQVGAQAMADRYTYVPLVGLFILLAWSAENLTRHLPRRNGLLAPAALGALAVLAALTWHQIGFWRDSIALFENALIVEERNFVAHKNLAGALLAEGRCDDAIAHYKRVLEIAPKSRDADYNLGTALLAKGDWDGAARRFRLAILRNRDDSRAYTNLGIAYMRQGRLADADAIFRELIKAAPQSAQAKLNLGIVCAMQNRLDEAERLLREALESEPDSVDALYNLGQTLLKKNDYVGAERLFARQTEVNPMDAQGFIGLGMALRAQGRTKDACVAFNSALAIEPGNIHANQQLETLTSIQTND